MTRITRAARDGHGFTLVELLIAMVVLSIVLAGMAMLLSSIYTTGTQAVAGNTAQDTARLAVDTMVADLRQAFTGDSAVTPVVSMSSTTITFYSPDRAQPFHLRKIAYQISGSTLQRASVTSTNASDTAPPWNGLTTLGAWVNVAEHVVANPGGTTFLSFQKADGSTATAVQDVDRVVVTLTLKPTGSRRSATTYQSSATLRSPA